MYSSFPVHQNVHTLQPIVDLSWPHDKVRIQLISRSQKYNSNLGSILVACVHHPRSSVLCLLCAQALPTPSNILLSVANSLHYHVELLGHFCINTAVAYNTDQLSRHSACSTDRQIVTLGKRGCALASQHCSTTVF